MLELRKKLANYQEIFYMLFLLPMTGMTSMGLNSEDRIYLYVFAVATLFLLLKMAVTDFTWKEIAIMGVFTLLLGANFLRNGEKTLILTAMGIFGAKNVNLDKVMKYALWEKAVLTVGTLTLAATEVIENVAFELPKHGEMYTIYSYGYETPNMGFANIFVVLLLTIIVYGDRMQWYAYVVASGIIILFYKILICRTGLMAWGCMCLALLMYKILKRVNKEKIYMRCYTLIPIILGGLSIILPIVSWDNYEFSHLLNTILNGRIDLINQVHYEKWNSMLGHIPQRAFDNMYFNMLYNYGLLLFAFFLIAYMIGMWYCNLREQHYVTITLGIMAVYGFMELLPLSILWNLPLIYLAQVLFKGRTVLHEQLQ